MSKKETKFKQPKESNKQKILDRYDQEEFMFADGFDAAIIGVSEVCCEVRKICYDKNKVIDILVKEGMAYEDAIEYFYFNIAGAYVGEQTPMFVEKIEDI